MVRYTREQLSQMKGETDWKRIAEMTDEEIVKAATDDPDSGMPTEEDWAHARIVYPSSRKMVSMRLDSAVLDWFMKSGRGYQTRINAVLKAYVDAQQKRGG